MKRFHVHVHVADLDSSVRFYSTLFGEQPVVIKADYAKWMLEDPRVNFAITSEHQSLRSIIWASRWNRVRTSRPLVTVSKVRARRSANRLTLLAATP